MQRQKSGDIEPLVTTADGIADRVQVPVGQWRDSIWDLFRYGFCHYSVLNSVCCVPVAAGQVISRLQLTYSGSTPVTPAGAVGAFRHLVTVVASYWITRAFLLLCIALVDPNTGSSKHYHEIPPPNSYYFFCAVDDLLFYFYFIWCAVLLRNVRSAVRSKYAIPEPESCPSGCEDLCCSIACPCLIAAQILRHTTDYDKYGAKCCTKNGLSASAPATV